MELLTSKIQQSLDTHSLIGSGETVIVTLSGGADSVALLSVLVTLGYPCIAAHCNFHLRGDESDRDCRHACLIAERLGVEIVTRDFDVPQYEREHKVSTEMACRELRYRWFEQLRQQYAPAVIAVAHHRDDNIETFFLNLLRGTGIAGLSGMAPRNGNIIRPMLDCTRADIEQYLLSARLPYVTDSTNALNDYRRNRLRNIILPMLDEQFPGSRQAIASTIAMLRDNEAIYRRAIGNARDNYCNGNTINLASLAADMPQAATMLFELTRCYGFNHSQAVDMVNAAATSGRQFHSDTHTATTHRGSLIITPNAPDTCDSYTIDLSRDVTFPIGLSVTTTDGGTVGIPHSPDTIILDASVLDGNPRFILRRWQPGDRMSPFGMKGSKKLSDIFSDAHMSLIDKQDTWILTRDGIILWIVGVRASRHFAVTPSTTRVITISARK